MKKSLIDFAIKLVHQRIGISVQARLSSDENQSLIITSNDAHPNDSFEVRFTPKWRSAEVVFIAGKYSAPLISQMGENHLENKNVVIAFMSALETRKCQVIFRVNGFDISPLNNNVWPATWQRLELQVRSALQVIDQENDEQMQQLIVDQVIPVFGIIVALIGVEELEQSFLGEPEGNSVQLLVTRYERKKVNREACIQLKGLRCTCCGFNFEDYYGSLGYGYIEVHHTKPVSKLGPNYQINIANDLEPLCANCHAMVHRQDPPMPVDQLTEIIKKQLNS